MQWIRSTPTWFIALGAALITGLVAGALWWHSDADLVACDAYAQTLGWNAHSGRAAEQLNRSTENPIIPPRAIADWTLWGKPETNWADLTDADLKITSPNQPQLIIPESGPLSPEQTAYVVDRTLLSLIKGQSTLGAASQVALQGVQRCESWPVGLDAVRAVLLPRLDSLSMADAATCSELLTTIANRESAYAMYSLQHDWEITRELPWVVQPAIASSQGWVWRCGRAGYLDHLAQPAVVITKTGITADLLVQLRATQYETVSVLGLSHAMRRACDGLVVQRLVELMQLTTAARVGAAWINQQQYPTDRCAPTNTRFTIEARPPAHIRLIGVGLNGEFDHGAGDDVVYILPQRLSAP